MSLLDSAGAYVRHAGGICRVPMILATLPPDESAELLAWFDNSILPATALVGALKERGIIVAATTLTRHRRGDCKCP